MLKIKVAVVGATGYTGSELVRLLHDHPQAEISYITSESRAGEKFSDVHPFFRGIVDQQLVKAEQIKEQDIDLAFLALPHGVSMDFVKLFDGKSFRIVDFSGDFRLSSAALYEEWYKKKHSYEEGFAQAVYGLPELFAEQIKNARLVANPGCYPTSAILGLAPLVKEGLVKGNPVIIDAKSGITGAGVKASNTTHYANVNDNFKAYGLKSHRHTIEIQGVLETLDTAISPVQFTPHLLPVDRGILSSMYVRPAKTISRNELNELYLRFYKDKPFVRICEQAPSIKDVRGSNYCNIYVDFDERTGNLMVISTIDNLVKGAAGQAVQNMNLMFGFEETTGLHQIPLNP